MSKRNEMISHLLHRAKILGLNCERDLHGKWRIIFSENSHLTQVENKWLLTVNDVPQVYLSDQRATTFIEKQKLHSKSGLLATTNNTKSVYKTMPYRIGSRG